MSGAPQPPPKDTSSGGVPTDGSLQPQAGDGASLDMSSLSPLEVSQLTQNILDESASERPLISDSMPLSALRTEYENGSGSFVKQIDYLLSQGFGGIRRTRGDGDCFYRSLAFAWVERLMNSPKQTLDVAKSLSMLDEKLLLLKAAGFQELVYEDFYDVLISLIRQIVVPEPDGSTLTPGILLEAFQDAEVSNCIVVFLRLLTSAVIRTDPISYAPFLLHPETGAEITPQEFCERYVEASGKEADHVQITALTKILKLNVEVAYLDGHDPDGSVSFVEFHNMPPDDFVDPPVLLYRPGHYDILERRRPA
ncbi:cysteine proteinase [Fomitiporia mediterranea MF3/22]|uniref:cysteine proteinase n=1 Tax=Fomitiporia mediterranea (strain MF3/22) TaxID=694068 RepID=UPI0004407C9D|nr:cysteine proteinase [Fomitiporia mediterranea MF3/22]EJD04980.1 cysteine proteinase [Fomitiporia mediterranea MF3/22]